MADTGYPLSPTVLRGALVQLLEDFGIVIPNIVPFQYNPAKVTLGVTPWNPFQTAPQNQASQTPLVQPFDPEQTYSFDLEFDAADDIEMGNPVAMMTGVASRLAALRKLVEPSKGLLGDLVGAIGGLAGDAAAQAERPAVPVTLLILGTSAILPVRVVSLSIDITEFTPNLYPLIAKATIELRVLTPDVFKCKSTTATGVAIAAYNLTRAQDDLLAIANLANVGTAVASMVPL
ncbi:hypothetical protein AB2M62_01395 [Sphingomonas sp. MMS12-HWE2-04]|uniref:hypothetical protein n=1 Tax=Sphingomonas sp. MMS12-HWE2-04 TaxID=3234199 RepID=UPI00384D043F